MLEIKIIVTLKLIQLLLLFKYLHILLRKSRIRICRHACQDSISSIGNDDIKKVKKGNIKSTLNNIKDLLVFFKATFQNS